MPAGIPIAGLTCSAVGFVLYVLTVALLSLIIWMPMAFAQRLRDRRVFVGVFIFVSVVVAGYQLTEKLKHNVAEVMASVDPLPALPAPNITVKPVQPARPKPAQSASVLASAGAPLGERSPEAKPAKALVKPAADGTKASAPAPSDPELGDLYVDQQAGYCIRFPSSWSHKEFPDGDPWILDATDGVHAVISVGFSPFPADVTTDQLHPDAVARHIQSSPRTKLLGNGMGKIDGRRCLWYKYTGPLPMTAGSPTMTMVHYLLPLQNGEMLELRVAARPKDFPRLAALLKKSADTFRLLPR